MTDLKQIAEQIVAVFAEQLTVDLSAGAQSNLRWRIEAALVAAVKAQREQDAAKVREVGGKTCRRCREACASAIEAGEGEK